MLKMYLGCTAAATLAFVFMGLQTGLFGSFEARDQAVVEPAPKPPRSRFPEDLAPGARAQSVAAAADFKVGDKPHKLAFLKVTGAPHAWQKSCEDYHEEWTALTVEETELVVVVSGQTKSLVEHVTFSNGPPVDRVRWELEASVVAAKSGKVLANRTFVNVPRTIRPLEAFELTELGQPVQFLTVFDWVAQQSKRGFSAAANAKPLVTVVEKQ